MSTLISNQDDTIDSRDVIARIEELEAERESLQEAYNEAVSEHNESTDDTEEEDLKDKRDCALTELEDFDESDEGIELEELKALAAECEGYSDWQHGETLIKHDYFVKYIEKLINDCYKIPKMEGWPFQHLTMDYEAAASEAEQDYALVSFGNQDYWIGPC